MEERELALRVAYLWAEMPPVVREYLETGDESIRDEARRVSFRGEGDGQNWHTLLYVGDDALGQRHAARDAARDAAAEAASRAPRLDFIQECVEAALAWAAIADDIGAVPARGY